MSNIKLHTCGNATLIVENDNGPIIATDPWLDKHSAYFGSWAMTHKIPKFHLDLLTRVPYIWISHFHPDHLNLRSLLSLKAREKTILLSYQHSNRVALDLRKAGMKVIVLPPRKFINLEKDINIATFPILNTVDSVLLIKSKRNLVINCNDTSCDTSIRFIKKEIAESKHSLLLKLAGYGDADMINIYDEYNNFIEPIAASRPAPGKLLTSQAKKINCTHAMHFSSFHQYVRADSKWANKYTTPENDLKRGWDKQIGYFKQFSSLQITENGFKKISMPYPELNIIPIQSPSKFGDNWDEELKSQDISIVKNYLDIIYKIHKNAFSIKVGNKIINPSNLVNSPNLILHAPRKSLIRSIKSNIFDDLLIGNFAKLIIPSRKKINFRRVLAVPSKYIDNVGIRNLSDLKEFLWNYRNSYDDKFIQVKSDIMLASREFITTNFIGKTKLLGKLKSLYQKL